MRIMATDKNVCCYFLSFHVTHNINTSEYALKDPTMFILVFLFLGITLQTNIWP